METQVRTPQLIFMHPQRLVVPLFQRPYVWNETLQWEPLWNDVVRVAERILKKPAENHAPHFLGAVVLQQVQNPVGTMQERTIIDGQQRLTTLQLLLDALHGRLLDLGIQTSAMRIEPLIANADAFCKKSEDRFKVWPTNRDRPAFNEVMAAPTPVDYRNLAFRSERMVQAHRYFDQTAEDWLKRGGKEKLESRGAAIETAVRDLLQVVVIDLTADENAQEIFETLNARGAALTAADLIKNFIFQKLLDSGADVEATYESHWKSFETAFWESEVAVGRVSYPRSSIFLNHWLIAQTGEEIVAREVFTRFKRFATDSDESMVQLIKELDQSASVYREFIEGANKLTGPIKQLELFAYRTGVMESEVIKPLVMFLLDPTKEPVPKTQLKKALATIESWMVRRMLVRATTKRYNQVVAELINFLTPEKRSTAGDEIERFFVAKTADSQYWPDDNEVIESLKVIPAYRRLRRGRLRMVLEAIEDYLRGWKDSNDGIGGERVARGKLAIEHIMPQKWAANWPHPDGLAGELERDAIIHTIGNLTLLTSRLNSKVSNGPWQGEFGKRHGVEAHDVFILNRELLKVAGDDWTDSKIRSRSTTLAEIITKIWPVPTGHKSGFAAAKPKVKHRVDLSDLMSAGFIDAGAQLHPRPKKHAEQIATLLPDGRLDIDGTVYATPSHAGREIRKKQTNGWGFFLVDRKTKRSLRDVRSDYLDSITGDGNDDDDSLDEGD